MNMIKQCLICNKDFKTWQCLIDKGFGKFCSHKCFSVNHKIRMSGDNHPNFGKKHSKKTIDRMKKSKLGKYSGNKNPNWKGGKTITSHGYVNIFKPNHPFANCRGYVYEHRLVVEKKIGRFLNKAEAVHHIKNKTENNPKYLIAFINNSVHHRFHKNPNNVKEEEIIFDGRKL